MSAIVSTNARSCLFAVCFAIAFAENALAQVQNGYGVATGGGIAARQESYKTDLFTGSATLSIPLVLPPGTNGHQPRLALAYHSGRGNGWIGQGWDLAVPSVRRVTKYGIPAYNDHPQQGDRFEIGDDILVRDDTGAYRFSRENFDRIVRVDDGSGNITHWILNRRDGTRLEFGMDAQRRVLGQAPGAGGMRTFEWLLTREVDANGNYIEYTYYDRVTQELGADEAPYLKRIAYSFRGDASATTVRSVNFYMQDRPDDMNSYRGAVRTRITKRLDRIEILAGTSPVTTYDVRYHGESAQEGTAPANQRSLVHRVVRIGANGSTAFPADEYSYWDSAGTWTRDEAASSVLAVLRVPEIAAGDEATAANLNPVPINLGEGNHYRIVDVNGDARPDILATPNPLPTTKQRGTFINDGTATFFPFVYPPRPFVEAYSPKVPLRGDTVTIGSVVVPMGSRLVDVHGDGRPEHLVGAAPSDSTGLWAYLFRNVGTGWFLEESLPDTSGYANLPPSVHLVVYKASCASSSRPVLYGWTEVIDINGDGRADLLEHRAPHSTSCTANNRSQWTVKNVYLNNGDGWTYDAGWSAALATALNTLQVFSYQLLAVDINGDGLVDLAADKLPALCTGACNNDGLPGSQANGWDISAYARGSDGMVDPDTATTDPVVLVNTGRGWALDADIPLVPGLRPIDVDGDGLVDDAQTQPRLNTGTQFVNAPFTIPFSFGSSAGGRVMADLDGDAQVDLIRADGSNFDVYLSDPNPPPGLLRSVDSYAGGSIDIDYEASSEGSCVDAAEGGCHELRSPFPTWSSTDPRCVYPWAQDHANNQCVIISESLPFPVQTATRIVTNDRSGNEATVDTAFNFGRFNLGGFRTTDREFRGFGLVERYNPAVSYTNPKNAQQTLSFATLEQTQFYQEAFLRGEPARTVRYRLQDGDRSDRDHILDISVPEFGYARGSSATWSVFMTVFSEEGCDESAGFFGDPSSCPAVGTTRQQYIDFGAGLPDPNQPYQDFINAFASTSNRDRNDAYLVVPISLLSRSYDDTFVAAARTNSRSFQFHDRAGNVKFSWDMGAARINDSTGTITDVESSDDRMTFATYALPTPTAPANLRNRPKYEARQAIGAGGSITTLAETWFSYDNIPNDNSAGQISAGNLTTRSALLVDPERGISTRVDTVLTHASSTYGLPQTVTDPFELGHTAYVTSYLYDASNTFPTQLTRGTLSTNLTYAIPAPAPRGLGIVYTKTDPNGEVVTTLADTFGRVTSRSGPGTAIGPAATTSYDDYFGWDPARARVTETTSDGVTPVSTSTYFDGLGRPIRSLRTANRPDSGAPALIEQTTAFDVRGNVRSNGRSRFCNVGPGACDPSPGATTLLYDARDRLAFVVQPDGGVQERSYETRVDSGRTDPERFEVSIDAANRRSDVRLDGANRVGVLIEYESTSSYTNGLRTKYVYDGLDRIQLICDPTVASCAVAGRDPKHTTLFTYDSLSRLVRREDPDRGSWRYQLRGDGAPLRQVDGNNVVTLFQYDSVYGRRTGVDWSGNGSIDVTYRYGDEPGLGAGAHSIGRLFRRIGPTSTVQLAYDASGRVQEKRTTIAATGDLYTESFGYDWLSRVTSRTYPDNETITRAYDTMGSNRIFSSARAYVDRLDFNADLNPTTYVYGNGETRTRAYVPTTGYLSSIVGVRSGQPAVLNRTYGHDLTGLVSSVTDNVTASESLSNIQYDGLGRMRQSTRGTSAASLSSYDVVGNLVTREGTAIPFDAAASKPHVPFLASDPTRFEHDPAGNMTRRTGTTFTYDTLNRLVSATGSLPISYEYDDTTERVAKTVGADRSVFLGPDVEIMNRVRLVKTIRVTSEIVARVETVLPGGSGAALEPSLLQFVRGIDAVPQHLLMAAVLMALAGLAGAAQRGTTASAPARAVASSLAMLVVVLPLLPLDAHAAIKGDVTNDGRVDGADVMLLLRHVNQGAALPVDPSTGDVAPFSIGTLGDGLRNSADVLILTRGISEADIDGDGLSPKLEAIVGTSPLVVDSDADGIPDSQEDSDQDGLSNVNEVLAATPTDPGRADTDGDGIVDSRDATPTVADGTRAVWVHADHLGSVAVVSNQAGDAVRRIAYDTWGGIRSNVVLGGAASLDMAEKFTGQRFDVETSLHYYGARYYDAALGRFTRTDAVVASYYRSTDLHPYAYVRHSPLNFVDPTGNLAEGGGGGNSGGGHPYPDRGGYSGPTIIDGLNWLWQGAIERALAMWAAMPKAAPPGPQKPAQPDGVYGPQLPPGPGTKFDTLDEAAVAAVDYARAHSYTDGNPELERGGAIERAGDGYTFREPAVQRPGTQGAEYDVYDADVADYHTHTVQSDPALNTKNEIISRQDANNVFNDPIGRPAYLLTPSNAVRVFQRKPGGVGISCRTVRGPAGGGC